MIHHFHLIELMFHLKEYFLLNAQVNKTYCRSYSFT